MSDSEIAQLPLARIKVGQNDRQHFDPTALEELAQSIAQHGLAQPITVRPVGRHYEIVAGKRRFRAVQMLGWTTIPAIVRHLTDEESAAIMLVENTGRADLSPIEEALAYERRSKEFGWSQAHIADVAGVSLDRVRRRLSLLKLFPDAQMLAATGQLPLGHAEALTVLDRDRQRIALRLYNASEHMPLRAFRQVVDQLYAQQAQQSLWDLEQFWQEHVAAAPQQAKWGEQAQVGTPTRADLPPLQVPRKGHLGDIISTWIGALAAQGFADEAATVGTLYTALVRAKRLQVPVYAPAR